MRKILVLLLLCVVMPGLGFAYTFDSEGDGFHPDGPFIAEARARYGQNNPTGSWEVAFWDEVNGIGVDQDHFQWTIGQWEDFSLIYDKNTDTYTFSVDGQGSATSTWTMMVPGTAFRSFGLQLKAACPGSSGFANANVEIRELEINGDSIGAFSTDGSNRLHWVKFNPKPNEVVKEVTGQVKFTWDSGECTAIQEEGLAAGLLLKDPIKPVARVGVPTMTEWGMIILPILLAGAALIMIYRRRRA
jgi:hypothetical protein